MRCTRVTGPAPDSAGSLILFVQRGFQRLHIAVNFQAFKIRSHDHVDHTGHRIGTVQCRTTVGQHFNALNHHQRYGVDIHKLTAAAGGGSRRNLALAVNQCQCGVFTEISQVDVGSTGQCLTLARTFVGERTGVDFEIFDHIPDLRGTLGFD